MDKKCLAHSRTTGRPCQKPPAPGRNRCRLHGGATPRGLASPHTRHGRYSKDLPAQLLGRVERALSDDEILSVRDEVAVIEALLAEKLAEVARAPTPPAWGDLTRRVERLAEHVDSWDRARLEREVHDLAEALGQRRSQPAAFDEVRTLITQKARLARQETRRMVLLEQMMTAERAMLIFTALADVVTRNVRDLETRRAIHREFRALMTAPER